MYLQNLKLWNFRKYGSTGDIDLENPDLNIVFNEGLNLLTGENDAGKTAIIDAIKIVLKTSSYEWIRILETDFYNSSKDLRIEIIFQDMSVEEAKNFTEYLTQNSKGEEYLKLTFTAKIRNDRITIPDVKAGSDPIGRILPAEAREFLKVTYLKPLRDVQSELIPKRNSRLSQIFQEHEAFKTDEPHVLVGLYETFNKSIKLYFEGKDSEGGELAEDQKGKELKSKIDIMIQGFFDEKSCSNIETTTAEIRKILESLELSILGLENPGLGSLNRLFMATELIHLNKENWDGLRLGLIEEIEAHLHPQVQLKVIKSLLAQKNTQLILTTHSPNLASKVPLEKQILCRNNCAYSLSKEYTNLKESNYIYLEKFLDVTKSDLLFAKNIILVEGWSEEILIPVIADKMGYNLIDNDVSVINVGNLGFSHYYKIFSRQDGLDMGVKIAIITDNDIREYTVEESGNGKTYIKLKEAVYEKECKEALKKKKAPYKDEVAKFFISSEWTLEWCLMKSEILGGVFKNVVEGIHTRSNWDVFEEGLAKKLIAGGLSKTEIAYRMSDVIEKSNDLEWRDFSEDKTMKYIAEAIKYVCE